MNTAFITPHIATVSAPLSENARRQISYWRQMLIQILQNSDPRLILIVGPCSIHNSDAALEYAKNLKILASEVSDVFMILMRAYFEKPRTLFGWKGLGYDPHLDGSCDIESGVKIARQFLTSLADIGIPSAVEFLDPLFSYYIRDCVTWGSIGARTVQSQIHRQLASGLPMPVGFKNRTDGNIESAIHACLSAKEPHTFLAIDSSGKICKETTRGNVYPHIVLRGGELMPNYDSASIGLASALLHQASLPATLIVDCSHDNCKKSHLAQTDIFLYLIEQVKSGSRAIRGLMLESFLLAANQPIENPSPYISITDPCLDWPTTEQLIVQAASLLRPHILSNATS